MSIAMELSRQAAAKCENIGHGNTRKIRNMKQGSYNGWFAVKHGYEARRES